MSAFDAPGLLDRKGYWAWSGGCRANWHWTAQASSRPMPRKGFTFVGPFKTEDMARGYAQERNKALAEGAKL